MDPNNIRNNGDLMKYWSNFKGRPWTTVTEEDKQHQRLMDRWNQFTTDNACPKYISMNFNKDGSRKAKTPTHAQQKCKKPGHCLCSDECFNRTNDIIEQQEQIMNEQPMSQPFHPSELVSLPSYVTDIQQGMLPPDQDILTFMEEDYQNQRDREMVAKNAFMDDMEDIMDTLPSTQPGFDPRELLTPVLTQNDEHTSVLAYDTERTITFESPDVPSYVMSELSEYTTDSCDSDGYDGSVELTPATPN